MGLSVRYLAMVAERVSDVFEDALDRDERIVAMHTRDVEGALVQYRLICRRSGRSMYHWSDAQGMASLKAADISVPGCRKLIEALRYVVQSMHYGVYIFTHFEKQLRPAAIHYLNQIAKTEEQRTVILLAEKIQLPASLSESVYHVFDSESEKERTRPKLRDGRWVV